MRTSTKRCAAVLTLAATLLISATASAQVTNTLQDTTFGTNGTTTTNIDTNGLDDANAVAVQSDGKLIVAGTLVVAGTSDNVTGTSGNDFAVVRYNSDGSLDTTFDTDGITTTNIGVTLGGNYHDFDTHDIGMAATLQSDGKIIVAGTGSNYFAAVRYNSDGSLDTTFGTDGIATTDIRVGLEELGVDLQSDGKIIVAGTSDLGGDTDFVVVRLNSDGSLDTTFDTDGIATTDIGTDSDDSGRAVAVQSDGKLVVAGTSDRDFAVVRYNSDGSLDATFDTDGITTTDVAGETFNFDNFELVGAVAIQSDGKIVVAGLAGFSFAVVRYNSDGSLDTTFDTDGITTTDVGSLSFLGEVPTSSEVIATEASCSPTARSSSPEQATATSRWCATTAMAASTPASTPTA